MPRPGVRSPSSPPRLYMTVVENGFNTGLTSQEMVPAQKPKLTHTSLWSRESKSFTADTHLELILGSVTQLPMKYWSKNQFFTSASDDMLHRLSEGNFPAKRVPDKRHPILALKALPEGVGFRVCPCTSRRPYDKTAYRYVRKNCILDHTGYRMDRDSFLLEWLQLNLPASMASEVRFRGKVPDDCIKTVS